MFGAFVIEKYVLTIGYELNFLVQCRNRRITFYGIIDTAFHINITLLWCHSIGKENDIYIVALLAKVGDGGDVFVADTTFVKHNKMLIAYVRRTQLSSILISIGYTNHLPWDVF